MLTAAADVGALTFDGVTFSLPHVSSTALEPQPTDAHLSDVSGTDRPLRVVAIDLETSVRTRIDDAGALKRAIWQVGATRCGPDRSWVAEAPTFAAMVEVPDGFDVPSHREGEHQTTARPASAVLGELDSWASAADVIIAYNGTGLDFDVLDAAFAAEGLQPLAAARVDGLYVAYCSWPDTPTHQLTKLMAYLNLPRVGRAHDAVDDAVNLARLMQAAADKLAASDVSLVSLITAITTTSAAWRMLRALAGLTSAVASAPAAAAITGLLSRQLVCVPLRRGRAGTTLQVPSAVADASGRIDPTQLARQLRPDVENRPGQQQVTVALRGVAARAVPALIEAPTGTGKSLAALAAALEWLDAAPSHRAIIATHSKQLQTQLATEIEGLAATIPGLLDTTDVVKGSSNRLSLRGLVYTLADASGADIGTAGSLVRYTDEAGYRELLAFLLLRLIAPATSATYRWQAASVDVADIPAFFSDYCGIRLHQWLGSLSQATHGEYGDPARIPLAAHTDSVREALDGHRLIIANHALLLAHWDDLASDADNTLLIVDEGHNLEGAATDALSPKLSTAEVDDTLASLVALARDLARLAEMPALVAQLRGLQDWWSDRRLRLKISSTLDRAVGDVGLGSRTLTLASPYSNEHSAGDARTVSRLLNAMHGIAGRIAGALGKVLDANTGNVDAFDEQRLFAAISRVGAISTAAEALSSSLDALTAPTAVGPSTSPSAQTPKGSAGDPASTGTGSGDAANGDAEDAVGESTEDDEIESADPDDETDGEAGEQDTPGPEDSSTSAAVTTSLPDRVVYVREDGNPHSGVDRYRFTLTSSPVLLPNDATWVDFASTYRRMALMSATLQVVTPGEDPWSYMRTRLGLEHADTHVVAGPFDYARQARLVAIADFPSWTEQPKQAMRTVAHQLSGWARQLSTRRSGTTGPWMHGAMVLTTSRAAAGGIADELNNLLEAAALPIPVHNQVVLGSNRSFAEFTGDEDHHGGFLVGTRGLWTGVDVSEPDRMNLVWINKLPFPVFTDPVIAARREAVRRAAEAAGADDPDLVASSTYYLPLAALDLRQAVGRLIRNAGSRGIVVISDRKLTGDLPLRRLYRQIFLGSLDAGLHIADPTDPTDICGGNVVRGTQAWRTIWTFLTANGLLDAATLSALTTQDALEAHTVLPATRAIRGLALSDDEVDTFRKAGTLAAEVLGRCQQAANLLSGRPVPLRLEQQQAIRAVTEDRDVLALLPTGSGKSFCFQLPALVLPGVTLVISPLVSLMHDQALSLNHTIGGAVRALVASLPESSSRAGRTEVIEQLTGVADHGIRLVYVSPERLGQARFRDALTRGVATGHIRRVAIDEAHTYLQWGDDFRPSFRRAGALLRQLRNDHPDKLTLMTLTATATPTVEQALREEVINGLVPGAGSIPTNRPLDEVKVNPLRPELTVARRAIRGRGPAAMDALAEQVVDAAAGIGHTILYCLTVRQVDQLHAHLRDYTAGRPMALRKFHGRLPELEKAAVSNDFNEAPHRGEDGYAPMVVVATSAFGLGVSRDDIRTVFCVSPPTDLAALYQQLGRGGRDMATRNVSTLSETTYGLALATSKTLDTAEWMASQDLSSALLGEFGARVLREANGGTLDLVAVRDDLINKHVAQGRLTPAAARDSRLRDAWKVGLTRAVAALADLGAVVDLGDVPVRVAVTAGTRSPSSPLASAVVAAVMALPARGGAASRAGISLAALNAQLTADPACISSGYDPHRGPAELWLLLCDLHDTSALDVSQRPNTHMLIGLQAPANSLPAGYLTRVSGKHARAAAEARLLRDFFATGPLCLNERLADYFSVPTAPGCCSTDQVRCSVCAAGPAGSGIGTHGPVRELLLGGLRPAATDPGVRGRRMDEALVSLLRQNFNGATPREIRLVLRGEDRIWIPSLSRYRRLGSKFTDNSQFGQLPKTTDAEVAAGLARLSAAGSVVCQDLRYWRTTGNAAIGPRRVTARRTTAGHP